MRKQLPLVNSISSLVGWLVGLNFNRGFTAVIIYNQIVDNLGSHNIY